MPFYAQAGGQGPGSHAEGGCGEPGGLVGGPGATHAHRPVAARVFALPLRGRSKTRPFHTSATPLPSLSLSTHTRTQRLAHGHPRPGHGPRILDGRLGGGRHVGNAALFFFGRQDDAAVDGRGAQPIRRLAVFQDEVARRDELDGAASLGHGGGGERGEGGVAGGGGGWPRRWKKRDGKKWFASRRRRCGFALPRGRTSSPFFHLLGHLSLAPLLSHQPHGTPVVCVHRSTSPKRSGRQGKQAVRKHIYTHTKQAD